VQFGNVMRRFIIYILKNVTYSFSWFLDMVANDPLLVQNIYNSLKLFNELCYLPENQLIFSLNSGKKLINIFTLVLVFIF